jgi:hypothetical protein
VIVRLRTDFVPEGRLDRPEAADQLDEIQGARAGLQEDIGGTGYQIAREFKTVPFVALEAFPRALEAIQRSPLATDVVEDRLNEPYQDEPASKHLDSANLAESSPDSGPDRVGKNGFTGSGQTVAVLDTGVDSSHPFDQLRETLTTSRWCRIKMQQTLELVVSTVACRRVSAYPLERREPLSVRVCGRWIRASQTDHYWSE